MPFGYNQLKPNNFSFSTPNHHPRIPHSRRMDQPTDLLSLVPPQEIPQKKKAPSKRNHNHLGAPSTTGSLPGGKRMTGNDNCGGETDSDSSGSDDSSSSQEDEDADDENDEDEEEPAVDSPAKVNRKRKYTLTEIDHPSSAVFKSSLSSGKMVDDTSIPNGTSNSSIRLAGQTFKQRTNSMASTNTFDSSIVSECDDDGVITETDEEPDYPRKKVARQLSTCDDFANFQSSGNVSEELDSETVIDDLNADDDDSDDDEGDEDEDDDGAEMDNSSISVDDIPALSEEDDEEIEEVEAQELAREFELEGPDFLMDAGSPRLPVDNDLSIYDGLLSDADCVGEPGLPGADDPLQWTALSGLLYYDSLVNDNLFSVPASREESPGSPTPRPARVKSPRLDPEVFHSDEWSNDDDENFDPELDNPFFDMYDPAVRHMVNNVDDQNWDPTWMASEDDNVWQAFETGDSSDEESECNDETKRPEGTEDEDDYDSDATDLDENLPLPTPQKDSKLKRLSSPTTKPQILRRDPANKNGPFLGSWVADPDRPICIIDGTKKTVLIPASTKRFSLDSDASYHDMFTFHDESDFDNGAFSYGANNPTLTGGEGGYMNGDVICGPPEAFNPSTDFLDFDDLLKNEYDDVNEDSVDEEEQMLSIEDVLALSETEDEGDNEDQQDASFIPTARKASDAMVGNNSDAEAMFNRWEYVSVTAFRKRQQQHKQRLSGQAGNRNRGALKGKLTMNDTTMTPARRRKSRSTNQKPIQMNNSRKGRKDDTQWSSNLPPLFEAV